MSYCESCETEHHPNDLGVCLLRLREQRDEARGGPRPIPYETLVEAIKTAPLTWLPALLVETAQACCERAAVLPGGASKLVLRMEAEREKAEP
jgi:hypothetical protein